MSIGIDAYQRWKAKAVRRPDDVTTTTPLTWQVEKYGEAERRLTGRYLPPSEVATALGGTPNEARAARSGRTRRSSGSATRTTGWPARTPRASPPSSTAPSSAWPNWPTTNVRRRRQGSSRTSP
ncbi:hypothetical protein [Streptomyces cyaneofuscatus]|uniref:hypothetical protein n=1 Tax=Streptomyces cyaneofuscatus TaxID=66883 RepID=UPI0037CDC7FE